MIDPLKKLDNFPHVYYVNLDNRTDRKQYMEDQFEYWKLNYTRISASKYLKFLSWINGVIIMLLVR